MSQLVSRWLPLGVLSVSLFVAASSGQVPAVDPEKPRGEKVLDGPATGYANKWALIVGVNYADRTDLDRNLVPELTNAVNDANALAKVLIDHYGFPKDNVKVLTEMDANRKNLLDHLGPEFLGHKRVGKDDCVLFFFAGHGNSRGGGQGEIYAHDVSVVQGQVSDANVVALGDIRKKLEACPARHKLLVLDCCRAGEIFADLGGRRPHDDREADDVLGDWLKAPALQAMTSCLASQNASDREGGDPNSPFTAALIQSLRTIPLNQGAHRPITAGVLFGSVRAALKIKAPRQNPQCRSLTADQGEFHFFPEGDFTRFRGEIDDNLLRAMVPGSYGNWWFDETPWLVPALRARLLARIPAERSSLLDPIGKDKLQRAFEGLLRDLEDESATSLAKAKDEAARKKAERELRRVRQLSRLCHKDRQKEMPETLKAIEDDLTAADAERPVETVELHLLAIVMHARGLADQRDQVHDKYELVLKRYEDSARKTPDSIHLALKALCHADFGCFLARWREHEKAAEQFRLAHAVFVGNTPPPFAVYALCQEADAWQRLGRWGMARSRLDHALGIAETHDKEKSRPLTAHLHHRRAWAFMERMEISQAEAEFQSSNQVVVRDEHSRNQDARLMKLHNDHGLAMVQRFRGNVDGTDGALVRYRKLSNQISLAMKDIRGGESFEANYLEARTRLIERQINTLERLADCSLFKTPSDPKEAFDDLLRALNLCPNLPETSRHVWQARVLYKQALALSLKSAAQDLPLAQDFYLAAQTLEKEKLSESQRKELLFRREITKSILELMRGTEDEKAPLGSDPGAIETGKALLGRALEKAAGRPEPKPVALARLRSVIETLRDGAGNNLNRDDLEALLFASRILADENAPASRFHALLDSEMLLGLCRKGLRSESARDRQDVAAYLRPYFDAAIRCKLRLKPKQVKDILKARWEATTGATYRKPEQPEPVLAFYVLDGRMIAFLDVPGGASLAVPFEGEEYGLRNIQEAGQNARPLPLPLALRKELAGAPAIVLRLEDWVDPLTGLGLTGNLNAVRAYPPDLHKSFPFVLPQNVKHHASAPATTSGGE